MRTIILSFVLLNLILGQTNYKKIVPNNLQEANYFGNDISINDNLLLVGAVTGSYKMLGSAFLFDGKENWLVTTQVNDSISQTENQAGFGNAVAISKDHFIIGNSSEFNFKGCAYIFEKGQHQIQHAVILKGRPNGKDISFGSSVDINSNNAIVGAKTDCSFGLDPGAVYIFTLKNNNWSEVARLTAYDSLKCNGYGIRVKINDEFAVVSATADDDFGMAAGCVYIYNYSGGNWNFLYKVYSPNASQSDFFGQSISLQNNLLLVGAPGERGDNNEEGKSYLFELNYNGYDTINEFVGSDIDDNSGFGYSVAISNDIVAISAIGRFYDNGIGKVYLFQKKGDTWVETAKISSPNGGIKDMFGNCIALSEENLIIGAMVDDELKRDAGAMYIFDIDELTGIKNEYIKLPDKFSLNHNYPNPFNPSTTISYSLNKPGNVRLTILDCNGQEVIILLNEFQNQGDYKLNFTPSNLSSGVYYYSLNFNRFLLSKKMVYLK